MKSGKSYNNVL